MEQLLIPNPSRHDVVTYTFLVNEKEINSSYDLLSLTIIKEINRVPFVKIVFKDGEASERNFEISNTEDFAPGNKIRIKVGRDGKNSQVFKGIITKHAIRVKANGNSELLVECYDEVVGMTIGRKNSYFIKIKDNELFDILVGKYEGLKCDAQSTRLKHKELVQHHISDWDFMLLRAEANGMLVNVNDGIVNIKRPDTKSDPVLQVHYGSSVIEFEAEMDSRNQWKNVKATSWDYSSQKLFMADASEAKSFSQHGNISGSKLATALNCEKHVHHSGHLSEQELQDWADGLMLRSRLAKIRGRARVSGFSEIKPGDMVKLEGVGDRFKGNAFVTAVKHDISKGSWETHIQFGLNPECYAKMHSDVNDLQSSGLVGSVHGLQIGKVVGLENDPDGEDRILVKIPVIESNSEGIWTRVASLDAGADRGFFFRPEIDDEVIVGFINDDPRHAVVLGMLHSSARPAPVKPKDTNHEKGFTSRSKMHINFNDETKTITIDTPAGNSISLDEEGMGIEIKDQNSNQISLSPAGIKIVSPINIEINAGVNLTLSAGASLQIGGLMIAVNGSGAVSISGAATSISSQAITEIKGSMVKIN